MSERDAFRGSLKGPLWTKQHGVFVPRHELEFIMKLGRLDRDQALALLDKHHGDREAVFAELPQRISDLPSRGWIHPLKFAWRRQVA